MSSSYKKTWAKDIFEHGPSMLEHPAESSEGAVSGELPLATS